MSPSMEWCEDEVKEQGPAPQILDQSFPQSNLKAHLFLFLFFPQKTDKPFGSSCCLESLSNGGSGVWL